MLNIKSMALGAAAGFALAGLCCSAAFATPVTLTWDTTGSVPAISNVGQFTFNNGTIQDFAGISLTPVGMSGTSIIFSVQEQGFIPLVAFTNGATITTPLGLNGVGASPTATAFQLYGAFTATATLTCSSPNNCTGTPGSTFSAVNFTLLGNKGNTDLFGFDATTGNATVNGSTTPPATDVTLATGVLVPGGQNTGGISQGVPTAAVQTTFTEAAGQGGFFVAPPASMLINLFGSFTNNLSEVTCYAASAASCTGVAYGGAVPAAHLAAGETVFYQIGQVNPVGGPPVINPGGGSVNFQTAAVPEPGSLSLLGIALLGFGALVRRRVRKA
jgi:hypothetical protein